MQKGEQTFTSRLAFFPQIENDDIDFKQFVVAAADLVNLVERLGKIYLPVKYDMQGNLEKIKKRQDADNNSESNLLMLMKRERDSGEIKGNEGLFWLNRAMHFLELVFDQIITYSQKNNEFVDISMSKWYNNAYDRSLKCYHNWVTQQLFHFINKMSPSLLHIMKALDGDLDFEGSVNHMVSFHQRLYLVRCKIDQYFKESNLFQLDSNH